MAEQGLYFSGLILGLIMGVTGAGVIAKFGKRFGILDRPNGRSSHTIAIPKGGGIGIFAAFLFVCLYTGVSVFFWLPIAILSMLAFWNDRYELSPRRRLTAQLILVAILLIGGGHSPDAWIWRLTWILFGTIFIVGTANFYNFMDGIDGLAGITGVIGFGLLAVYLYGNQGTASFFTIALFISFSCLGFLSMNMPVAKVFMGDIGSILLGGLFGSLVILSSMTSLDFLCMVSFLFPFYADGITTMFIRLRDKEKLTQPHRRHIYQLLANEKGFAHWQVSLGFGLLQLIIGLLALSVKSYGTLVVLSVLCFFFALFAITSFYLRSSLEKEQEELKVLFGQD